MNLAAFGSIELVQGAIVFTLIMVFYHQGKLDGRAQLEQERAANRAARRIEARVPRGRHHLAPFPGTDELFERLPSDTGELRALTVAAESGDLKTVRGLNAAFFRRLDLKRWARAS